MQRNARLKGRTVAKILPLDTRDASGLSVACPRRAPGRVIRPLRRSESERIQQACLLKLEGNPLRSAALPFRLGPGQPPEPRESCSESEESRGEFWWSPSKAHASMATSSVFYVENPAHILRE